MALLTTKKPEVNTNTTSGDKSFTIRELIAKLVMCEDMDALVNGSFCNSDPIPVQSIEDDADSGMVIFVL